MIRLTSQQRLLLLGVLVVYIFSYFIFALATVQFPAENKVLAIASAIFGAVIAICFVFAFCRLRIDDRKLVWLTFAGIAIDLLFNRLAQVAVPESAIGAGDQLFKAALVSPANLGVLLAASGVGLMV